jgi:hypothetical protein
LKVSSVSDLLATLQDGSGAPGKDLRALLEDYRKTRDNCDPVKLDDAGLLHLIQAAQTKSRVLVAGGLREKFDFFNTKIPEMATLKSRYGITSSTSPEAQAAMAFQAVKNNIAQCVSIELASGLDTHGQEWAENQIERQSRGFKALSRLVTDSNRLVSTAVLKNPRITENEVIKISASRSVSEDVIRSITRNRDWMKLYQVKVNLVKNPKCPQGISMRLLNFLRPNDLKGLVGNKNVPQLISINAKKLLSGKNKKK